MKDFRQRAFVGLVGLVSAGLISIGCSSSNNNPGGSTGGSTGTGTGGHTSGSGGTGTGTGGSSTGNGGAGGGAVVGCATSDKPASALIADFEGDAAGVEATGGGLFTYSGVAAPTYKLEGGALHVTDTVAEGAMPQYLGVGIYFSGNTGGTDCTDASDYKGVQFDIKGTLTGTGCTLQYSTNDSEHTALSTTDPKSGGATGSYSPQVQIASDLSTTSMTVKVAFDDATLGVGSPDQPIDPKKIETVQWQLTVPPASAGGDGGSGQCALDMTIDNVKFYQ